VSEHIILCSSCGTKSRIAAGQTQASCDGCGKALAIRGGLFADLTRVRWSAVFLVVIIVVIAAAYFHNPSLVATAKRHVSSKPNLSEVFPSTQAFSQPPVHITPGLVKAPRDPSRARLTVRTKAGANYFVKIATPLTGTAVMSFFVRGGMPLTVNVPVGTYELRYCAGQVWYGPIHKFGPSTACHKADDLFPFSVTRTADGWSFSSWTVELILQRQGNLDTTPMDPREF
jgi:hypothetical protein